MERREMGRDREERRRAESEEGVQVHYLLSKGAMPTFPVLLISNDSYFIFFFFEIPMTSSELLEFTSVHVELYWS
jgi:hypothetical protein